MDTNEILKNIEYFYGTILPKAFSSHCWNKDNIASAFSWAQFCEEIYHKLFNKSEKGNFDELIHAINIDFNNKRNKLCFEDLKNCTKVLAQAFIKNPVIESCLSESVVLEVKDRDFYDKALHDTIELDSVCVDIIEALKPVSIVNSERSLYYEVRAELYLNYLKATARQMLTEEQLETHLSVNLDLLCENNDQLLLFLHVLMHKVPEFDKDAKEIQELAVNWLLLKVASDPSSMLSNFLWSQPTSKLRGIAVNNIAFCSFYCNFLIKCANSLEFDSENSIFHWKSKTMYEGGVSFTFDEILDHFRCLLSTDDDVGEFIKKRIISLVNDPIETFVWKEIFSRVT